MESHDIGPGKDSINPPHLFLYVFSTLLLFTVDESYHAVHDQPRFPRALNGGQGGLAGRDHVVQYGNPLPFFDIPLDRAARAVPLHVFPDNKGLDGPVSLV